MRKDNKTMWLWIIISILVIAGDQLTKQLVISYIGPYDTISVIPHVLDFVYVKNTGAAFSIFAGKTWFLALISLFVCIGLIYYLIRYKPEHKLFISSIALVLGGAAGNLIDRAFRGSVVDFIEVIFIEFPVFNVADIAITVGAVLLMVYVIFFDREQIEKRA